MTEEAVIKKHDEILAYLLRYKAEHKELTFWPRTKNIRERLQKGYWFQGNEAYIFVPLYRRGCQDNKTKTIGFVVTGGGQYIEIVFRNIDNTI